MKTLYVDLGATDEMLAKIQEKNPDWGVDEWELWWCKRTRSFLKRINSEHYWFQMKVCDSCNCERRAK